MDYRIIGLYFPKSLGDETFNDGKSKSVLCFFSYTYPAVHGYSLVFFVACGRKHISLPDFKVPGVIDNRCFLLYGNGQKEILPRLGLGGLFWILHAVNCFRLGYQDPIGDFANYIRSFQLIVVAVSIFLLFSNRQTYLLAYDKILLACTINLFVISAVVVLATLLGNAEPTYSNGYG
jgi:hypothetical protein